MTDVDFPVRLSEGIQFAGSSVIPDTDPGKGLYRVRDMWTTYNGSWEDTDPPYGRPAWAWEYLRPWGHPEYFDDAGADHHILVRVEDKNGNLVPNYEVQFSSDNWSTIVRRNTKQHSGWANIPMFPGSDYNPERTVGPWKVQIPDGREMVSGVGMPYKWHVSTFIVFRETDVPDGGTPPPGPDPDPEDCGELRERLGVLSGELQAKVDLAVGILDDIDGLAERIAQLANFKD